MVEHGTILDEQGKPTQMPVEEKVTTNERGYLAKIMVGDKEYKILDTVSVIEIVSHKIEGGKEIQQIVAHEFMMVDHAPYMVKCLTDAINTVMKAKKRKPLIQLASKAMLNQVRRHIKQSKSGAFGGKK